MKHQVTITEKKATGNGDIDGFLLQCADCAYTSTTSLPTLATQYAHDHAEYMADKERRTMGQYRKAVRTMRERLAR